MEEAGPEAPVVPAAGILNNLPDPEEEKSKWRQAHPGQPDPTGPPPADPMSSAFDPKPMDPMSKEFDPQPEAGEPVSKIESQNRETSWFKDVVSKFGDDLYTRFIGQEGEGTFSKALRDHAEISGTEPGVMKDRPLQMALRKTIQDVTYASARTLEGYLGLMSDAIRGSISAGAGLIGGKEFGEQVAETAMDPGVQATFEGIGPPGALAAAGLSLLDRFGTIGKVKTTGGFGDVTNLDRARDAGIIGPKAPEVHVKPDGTAMSAKEIAEAQFPQPTAAFPSNRNYDGLLSDIGGGGPVPTWGDIKGLFVKTEPDVAPIKSPVEQTLERLQPGSGNYVQASKVREAHPELKDSDFIKLMDEGKLEGAPFGGPKDTTPPGSVRDEQGNVYHAFALPRETADKVRVHTDHEATMLEADKVIEHPQAKALGREILGNDFNKDMTGKELYDALAKELGGSEEASKALSAVGIQGIKVEGGHVVFDSRLVEPLNVAPLPTPSPGSYASGGVKEGIKKTLGIGSEKPQPVPPPPPRKPPEPPQRAHDGVATDSKGNIRSDVWKGIHNEGDVRALVDQVNADNGGFAKARAGEMPAEHVLTISEATGIPAHELVTDGIGIKFNNDTKVRAGMQALHDTAHQWHSAAQRAVSANDVDSLIKYQEQELLHGVIQEYVTGKLAEAGRSLAVTQEFYEGRGTQRPLRDKPKEPVSTGKEGETAPKPTFDKGDGLKEFRERVKDKETLDAFNKARGDSTEEVRARAKRVSELNPATNSVVREGARQLKAKKIEESPWYEKLYRESLVSGPFSHFRYAVAGVIRNGLGATVVPFFNASLHTIESALGKPFAPGERARFGEIGIGLMTGHTEAFEAMMESTRTGIRPPLPGEVRFDKNGNPLPGWPSGGGPFMRAVAGIHVYHSFIGYAREIKVQAYRRAIDDGFDPRSSSFGQRVADNVANPTPAAVKSALGVAENMSLTAPLGKVLGPIAAGIRNSPLGFLAWTFNHVPVIVAKKGVEYSPGIQFLAKSVREDLLGRNGATKQTAAFGKVIVGHGILATFAVLGPDYLTGNGPADPDQRAQWLLTNQPNSFRSSKDGEWHSFDGWGPLSIAMGWAGTLAETGRALMAMHNEPDQELRGKEFGEAWALAAHGIGHIVDEAGLRQIVNIINAMSGKERDGVREGETFVSGFVPTLLGQIAASKDPWSRQVNGVIDALKYKIPGEAWGLGRESLAKKLDWLGNPIQNPRQGLGQLMPTMAKVDPQLQEVYKEVQRLNITPAHMEKTVDGLTLTPQEYEQLQHTFGDYAQPLLKALIQEPGYRTQPDADRARDFREILQEAKKNAVNELRQSNPIRFIDQVQDNKYDLLEKLKPSPNLYKRPE